MYTNKFSAHYWIALLATLPCETEKIQNASNFDGGHMLAHIMKQSENSVNQCLKTLWIVKSHLECI